jgi:hypothetical protein
MPQRTIPADHDIPVMAVFDLQQVCYEAVRGEAAQEFGDALFALHHCLD